MSFGIPTEDDPGGDGTGRPLHPWFQDPVWNQWFTLFGMYAESDPSEPDARHVSQSKWASIGSYGSIRQLT